MNSNINGRGLKKSARTSNKSPPYHFSRSAPMYQYLWLPSTSTALERTINIFGGTPTHPSNKPYINFQSAANGKLLML